MSNNPNIIIFSIDLIFIDTLKRIIEKIDNKYQVSVMELFSDAQKISAPHAVDLVLVDDVIIGTSSFELISFLRLQKKMTCPVLHFDTEEYQNKKKSLQIGASQFFKKPFNPQEIEEQLRNTINKK